MPQPKESLLQGERVVTEALRGGRRRQFLGAQEIAREMRLMPMSA
jgi:hypothetical protein